MPLLHLVAADWQKALPFLSALTLAVWIVCLRQDAGSEQAIFVALLAVYMLHQIEEHLWPGRFRQFTNAHVFKSGNDNWPVDIGGVALINIGFVWLPIAAAALCPHALRWVGLGWVGLTLVNGLTHIATSIRLRCYNPGLVTSLVLFLPFTISVLAAEARRDALSVGEIALVLVAGVLLHIPVAALFVVPYLRRRPVTPAVPAAQ
jgi:hypothetical protein